MIDEAAASILDGVLLHYPFYEPTLPSHGKAWKHVRTILLCLARLRSLGRGLPRDLTATILSADAQLALDVLACVLHPIVKARLFKVPRTCTAEQLGRVRDRLAAQQLLTRPCYVALLRADFVAKARQVFALHHHAIDETLTEACIARHLAEPHGAQARVEVPALQDRAAGLIRYVATQTTPGNHPIVSVGPMRIFYKIQDSR